MRKVLILFILSFFVLVSEAQNFTRPGEWKKYRKEVFISIGTSNFLGDLGGRDQIGKDYSPVDLELSQTRTAFGLGYRYKIDKWINVVGKFNYLIVKGDDALTQEIYRNNRNLNFKSNIFELAGRVEIGYTSSKTGNRYGIKRTLSRRHKANNHSFYVFAGVGGFYYNPKGRDASGNYIKLRPLHTEGQGLAGGPKQYSNYSVCIPLGAYYKMTINKQWSVGLEFAWRKTFTDYIDDVGTTYYDNGFLKAAYGPVSAAMADPNKGNIYGQTLPNADGTGGQRGDLQKDSYISLEVTVGYIFKQKRKRARLRSKF
ncbi:MAG: DUF6089 family protein [Bacteroidota bacterium]|nr:DUF6089 family protein [Bacteroidota bacterium]MDP3144827.1 DUF6089 family protein [Bacteroidota bacterium]MDP3557802.1 DUF6089 family protein [Bacteroidota bacterium]